MSKITEYTFSSADDVKTTIHAVRWEPENGEVKAVLQLVHGMQEHIERYSDFAEYLTSRGFAVMGHDHIGHGESVRNENERGIMHSSFPDDTMIEDMYSNYKLIREMYPDKPYFILGHSMGSYLLRKYLCVKSRRLENVNGAIIMGTGTESNAAISAGAMLCKLLMKIRGKDSRSKFIAGLMFGNKYYRDYDPTGNDPARSWLSKDTELVKKYYDPANRKDHCEFSLNGYMILLRSTRYDNDPANIKLMNMDIPVLFVSGDKDPVGQFGEGVKAAHKKFADAGVRDLSIKLYEGDRHEILNELDRDTVYSDLYKWMSDHFK